MSTPTVPPAGNQPPSPSPDPIEMFKFLSEQSEKNRVALRDEANAVRDLFIKTSALVAIPLGAAITLAGIFFFHNLNEMKQEMVDEGKAEAKLEIQKMNKQIDDTLQSQFATPNIQKTIDKAAETATRDQAPGLIKSVITPEVRKAVEGQSGTIKGIAVEAINDKVAPLVDQGKKLLDESHVQQLIVQAESDSAPAFDQLVPLVHDNPTVASFIAERHKYIRDRTGQAGTPRNCLDPQSADFTARLHSLESGTREWAIVDCTGWIGDEISDLQFPHSSAVKIEEQIAPLFVNAKNDTSLLVRAQAIKALNELFAESPGFPKDGLNLIELSDLNNWWAENKSDYKALEWISRMRIRASQPSNRVLDSATLYNELVNVKSSSSAIREALRDTILRLRSTASAPYQMPMKSLESQLGRSTCEDVKHALSLNIANLNDKTRNPPWVELSEPYAVYQIAFLKTCAADPHYLHIIANYGSQTISLSRRYGSIITVNAWMGTHFDPFNPTEFREWWAAHRAEYQN